MTLAVNKIDGRGIINTAHREHLPKKTKVTLRSYKKNKYPKDRALQL